MANIKFHLRQYNEEKETPIFIRTFFKGNRFKCKTNIKCLPSQWDKERGEPVDKPMNRGLIRACLELRVHANNTVEHFEDDTQPIPPSKVFQDYFYNIAKLTKNKEVATIEKEDENLSLFQFIEKVIEELPTRYNEKTKKTITPNTIKCYKQCNTLLKEFNKNKRKVDFQNIDLDFLRHFKDFLISKNHSQNTMAKHIKTLKVILNEATERGYNTNLKYKNRKFTVPQEETEAIYLNEKELDEFYNLDLSNSPKLERVRDLFLVGCWTGLRFSDFSNIGPDNIKGEYIHIGTQKTGEEVIIPIHRVVNEIMTKYKGKYFNSLPPNISNQKMNKYLKEIGKQLDVLNQKVSVSITKGNLRVTSMVDKFDKLTTHTARRSFATNLYNKVSSQVIMKITGHRTEKAFLKYIRATPIEYAETLKLHWDNQSKMKISY